MLPCCSILTKKNDKLIFMFLILCLNLTYSLGVIKIIVISQLCHFIPFWVPFLLIVMSNDTERNSGNNKLFTFCNWNVNSLNLLEAHNSLFNYDILSLCETNLNATVDLPSNLLDGFKSIFSHHPSGNKRGGVALFYKDNLPLVERNDLSFNECIVTEIHIGRKEVFFIVVYRSPNDKAGSPEFETYTPKLNMKILMLCSLLATMLTLKNWWPEENTNNEGIAIDNLSSALDLNQIICEPTNFEENKNPSHIDLIFCDQPNIIVGSCVRPSLDPFCKHQIIYCNINSNMPSALAL